MEITKVRVPLGVVFFIYESRPNVTADAAAICLKSGNAVILRGGKEPNFDAQSVASASEGLAKAGLIDNVMIDFSHANSRKQHDLQKEVCTDVCGQLASGTRSIIGVMIESHLEAGRQDQVEGPPLKYGQSITDACIGWDDTAAVLGQLAEASARRRSA